MIINIINRSSVAKAEMQRARPPQKLMRRGRVAGAISV